MPRQVVEAPQGRLVVDESGSGGGLPVLLVHSDSGSRRHWSHAMAHVSGARRAVALDLRGHGESDLPRDGDFSYDARATDIGAVADALGLRHFVLVGHSGGGAVALSYANANPDRVAGLLLVDPVSDPAAIPLEQREAAIAALKGPDYLAVITDYYRSILGENRETAQIVLGDVERTPQATIVGAMTALDRFAPGDLVGRYAGPILSIVLPANDNEHALHRTEPGFPSRHFPSLKAGHWLHIDDPRTFNAMLDAFLDEIDRSTGQSQELAGT